KYAAMTAVTCSGGRARGLFQFYGANRTGRWAGRLIQLQNLPRNDMKTLGLARDIVSTGDTDTLELLYSNIPDVLSQLIRTSFVPAPGMQLAVADFSAIEARVIAWLAGEKWRLEVFNTHGKIYEASASQMFKVPIEAVTKGSDYRQRGKVAELALGYGGGPNALISMGALNMGVPEDELPALVAVWRRSNPAICRLWVDLETCAVRAVDTGQPQVYKSLKFYVWKNVLFIKLPSGRELAYPKPTLVESKFGGLQLKYMGVDQYTKKWGWITTYGGKITENVVQAIARDCLSTAILRVHDTGYRIVIHVHDEIVVEVLEDDSKALEELELLMAEPIKWAPGLPLRADGYTAKYYHKKD
ncbi:MAG: hypothetical protein EBX40_03705, partial [Gammaproteobacteria bacterium]|nr:hypothetical protein [Gammaproteobacteria bacterium]